MGGEQAARKTKCSPIVFALFWLIACRASGAPGVEDFSVLPITCRLEGSGRDKELIR